MSNNESWKVPGAGWWGGARPETPDRRAAVHQLGMVCLATISTGSGGTRLSTPCQAAVSWNDRVRERTDSGSVHNCDEEGDKEKLQLEHGGSGDVSTRWSGLPKKNPPSLYIPSFREVRTSDSLHVQYNLRYTN